MKKFLLAFFVIISANTLFADNIEYIIKIRNIDKFEKQSNNLLSSGVSIRKAFDFINQNSKYASTQSASSEFNDLKSYYIVRTDEINEIKVLRELQSNNQIESISPNIKFKLNNSNIPNDERFNEQWAMEQIRATGAWKYASGNNVIVGIVDTGIDYDHPDLAPNLWINSKEDINGNGKFDPWQSNEFRNGVSGDLNGIDEDGNGFVDDVIGFDFVNQSIPNLGDWTDPDADPFDEYDHGTAVAGVVAAVRDNEIGIAGLAYNAKIMSLRVFDVTGNAEADDVAGAIVYAALNGAKVLNFSFGEVHSSPIVHAAVKFAHSLGVVMVASSGNENKDIKHYPSDYPEVISVGASTKDGVKWGYSNYGGALCLIAPGSLVLSAVPNGSYSLKSGTSLSAPFVTAAVAMLFEKNPELKLSDIKSILSASAQSISSDGWDYYTGAGILDVQTALENIFTGNYSITYPTMYETFNKSKTSSIPIIGSTISPTFETYSILIGKGRNPTIFQSLVSDVKIAKLNDTLNILNIQALEDTTYTIALRIKLKNGKTLEHRTQIIVYSNAKPFEISALLKYEVYNDDRKSLFISFNTNLDSYSEIHFKPKNSTDEYKILRDYVEYSQTHQYLIEQGFDFGVEYEAKAMAILHSKDTAEIDFTFNVENLNIPKYSFAKKPYELQRAYLFPNVSDFNSDGKPNIFFNDLSNLSIGKSMFAEFNNGAFKIIDTMQQTSIVTGIGNYNGDNYPDVLSYGNGRTFVTQRTDNYSSPFANLSFSSQSLNFWAEHLFDIDGDGRQEIIAHNDSCFFAYSYKSGKDILLAQAVLPKDLRKSGVWRGSTLGDFNGNGKVNLYHSNNSGHSFIFEYSNNAFELIYSNVEQNAAENQYVCSGDFDGDGLPEIVHGSYSVTPKRNDVANGLWIFKLIKYDQTNGFYVADSILIYGIRAGIVSKLNASYRNGVSSADVDGESGDELVISTMPNLYVFKWNKTSNKFQPIWNYPAAFANAAICYDFDSNGKKELGFATFGKTEFWEYSKTQRLSEPKLSGYALDKSSARLHWDLIDGADSYECFMLDKTQSKLISIASTANYFIILNDLTPNTDYSFFIIAKSSVNPNLQSDLSNRLDIFTNDKGIPSSAEAVSANQIIVRFNVPLKFSDSEPANFIVEDSNKRQYTVSSAICSSNMLLLTLRDELDSGSYTIECNPFQDFYGNYTEYLKLSFEFNKSIKEELYLTRLTYYSNTFLQVEFSEEPDSSALNPSNYELSPSGTILQIGQVPNNKKAFEIALSSQFKIAPKGKNYYLTAKNINSVAGNQMTKGAGSTLGFVVSADDLSSVYIYPNPIKYNTHREIYIAGLTNRAIIEILTLDGELLNTLVENDGNGGTYWNGTDSIGNLLKPGVYLLRVKNPNNISTDFDLFKFMVVP